MRMFFANMFKRNRSGTPQSASSRSATGTQPSAGSRSAAYGNFFQRLLQRREPVAPISLPKRQASDILSKKGRVIPHSSLFVEPTVEPVPTSSSPVEDELTLSTPPENAESPRERTKEKIADELADVISLKR